VIAAHLLEPRCPTCGSLTGEPCRTYTGKPSNTVHVARQRLAHRETLTPVVEPALDDDRLLLARYADERIADAEA
jgi:hypothetical protein